MSSASFFQRLEELEIGASDNRFPEVFEASRFFAFVMVTGLCTEPAVGLARGALALADLPLPNNCSDSEEQVEGPAAGAQATAARARPWVVRAARRARLAQRDQRA